MNTEMFSPMASEKDIERVSVYRLLAWGIVYPTAEHVAKLAQWHESLQQVLSLLSLRAHSFATILNLVPENKNNCLATLQEEYTWLFMGDAPELRAPPYASAYTPTGDIVKYPARSVLEAYRQAELAFYSDTFELPDHLSVQLEFMYHLGNEALSARYLGRLERVTMFQQFQQQFLRQHLLHWVPTWCKRVAQGDRVGFYAALAQLVRDWLKREALDFGLLPQTT